MSAEGTRRLKWPGGWGPPRPPEAGECWCLSVSFGLYAALFHPVVECILNLPGLFKSEVPVETIGPCPCPRWGHPWHPWLGHFSTLGVKNKIKVLLFRLGIAANKGLLVRGFSWLVANPFVFNVLLGKNDVGHIPQTSSPPS